MSSCATYVGTLVHRDAASASYSRHRSFGLLVDVDQLGSIDASPWLSEFDHRAPGTAEAGNLRVDQAATIRSRINEQLSSAGLQRAMGGRIDLLFFPRIFGDFFARAGIFFCHAPSGSLGALIFDVRDTFGQRHYCVEPVSESQLEQSHLVTQQGRYVLELQRPANGLSLCTYHLSPSGRRLEAQFVAERTELTDAALLRALLKHPLTSFLGTPWRALAAFAGLLWMRLWNGAMRRLSTRGSGRKPTRSQPPPALDAP